MSKSNPATIDYEVGDKLAFERTHLAYERTMMAWIRTATALIAFGFGMYKLFEMIPLAARLRPGEHVVSPRAFAFVLAFLGDLALLFAAVQHRINLQRMRQFGFKVPYSAAAVLAAFLSILGIIVLLMVLFKM